MRVIDHGFLFYLLLLHFLIYFVELLIIIKKIKGEANYDGSFCCEN